MITERLPVLPEPGQCPDANMLLYPGDGMKDAWVCDCQEMFLYFPLNNSCHKAYRQGPCPLNHYVVLPENEAIPRCEANPCLEDGKVPYNGRCYYFQGIDSPCEEDKVLDVNETTFQLDCVLKEVNTLSIIVAPRRKCPRGTRRNMLGICKKVVRIPPSNSLRCMSQSRLEDHENLASLS